MHWVIIIWTIVATASAMLALVHGFYLSRQWDCLGSLLFSTVATGPAAMDACELLLMRGSAPAAYGTVSNEGIIANRSRLRDFGASCIPLSQR